jgi:hypothetical protein
MINALLTDCDTHLSHPRQAFLPRDHCMQNIDIGIDFEIKA